MSAFIESLSSSLFWDVDRETIDDDRHRRFIIGRVLERGQLSDWRNTRKRYGLELIVQEAQQMRSLEPKAMAFVSCLGQVEKESFRCFTLRRLHRQHWSY